MPPARTYQTIDAHAAGEPLRIIVSGVPPIPGATMLEKRAYIRENLDFIRTSLMLEPRGHADMYGCVLTPPVSEGSDLGVLFMHNEGYSTMCGHGVIALTTVAVQNGLVAESSVIALDTPAGTVHARPTIEGTRVVGVSFENVPSFVLEKDVAVLGMSVDVAFGGAFYAIADSPLPIDGSHLPELRELGMKLKSAVEEEREVVHPLEPGLRGIYGTIFRGAPRREGATARNVTVFADAEVDRSPCGTGTCAVMAMRVQKGLLGDEDTFRHESIIGTVFEGRVLGRSRVGDIEAVIPEISGSAYITGYNTFVVDEADPLGRGFRL